jgi:hypothetical protein
MIYGMHDLLNRIDEKRESSESLDSIVATLDGPSGVSC